jgi:hypothetical protein
MKYHTCHQRSFNFNNSEKDGSEKKNNNKSSNDVHFFKQCKIKIKMDE